MRGAAGIGLARRWHGIVPTPTGSHCGSGRTQDDTFLRNDVTDPLIARRQRSFLNVADVDVVLSLDEFRTFLRANVPAVTETDGEMSFRPSDTDGDGVVTGGEVLQAIMDFTFSSDPDAPGDWLFGRLPD